MYDSVTYCPRCQREPVPDPDDLCDDCRAGADSPVAPPPTTSSPPPGPPPLFAVAKAV